MDKPQNKVLADRGVKITPAELGGSQEKLVQILTGVDVVIAALGWMNQLDQIPLVTAAKAAGVQRFVPCGFITVAPPKSVMWLREQVSLRRSWLLMNDPMLTLTFSCRKKKFTTIFTSYTCRIPSSTLASGISLPHQSLLRAVLTTPL